MRSIPSEELVLRAYSGGRTENEALKFMKGRLKIRQQRTIRKRLLDRRELIDWDSGRKGRGAHKYQPAEEIIPLIHQIEFGRPAEPDTSAMMLLDTILSRAALAYQHIEKNRSWSRPRRVNSICLSEIKPVVEGILLLRRSDIRVTLPDEFFYDEQPRYLRRLMRSSLDLRGPLAVQVQGADKKSTTIYPDLIGWHKYLKKVLRELALEEIEPIVEKVFPGSKPKGRDPTPGRNMRKSNRS